MFKILQFLRVVLLLFHPQHDVETSLKAMDSGVPAKVEALRFKMRPSKSSCNFATIRRVNNFSLLRVQL